MLLCLSVSKLDRGGGGVDTVSVCLSVSKLDRGGGRLAPPPYPETRPGWQGGVDSVCLSQIAFHWGMGAWAVSNGSSPVKCDATASHFTGEATGPWAVGRRGQSQSGAWAVRERLPGEMRRCSPALHRGRHHRGHMRGQ